MVEKKQSALNNVQFLLCFLERLVLPSNYIRWSVLFRIKSTGQTEQGKISFGVFTWQ